MVLRATCHWEDPRRLANGLGEELEMIKRGTGSRKVRMAFGNPSLSKKLRRQGFIIHSRTGKLRDMFDFCSH